MSTHEWKGKPDALDGEATFVVGAASHTVHLPTWGDYLQIVSLLDLAKDQGRAFATANVQRYINSYFEANK